MNPAPAKLSLDLSSVRANLAAGGPVDDRDAQRLAWKATAHIEERALRERLRQSLEGEFLLTLDGRRDRTLKAHEHSPDIAAALDEIEDAVAQSNPSVTSGNT